MPLRLVSEGLGEEVKWDKVGRWVWIGEKKFQDTDDAAFKLQPLSNFMPYTNQLPIKLGNGEIIYDINLIKRDGLDYIAIRSSSRGTPEAVTV